MFREAFLAKLALLLRGTVAAPPERYGETLADEHIRGGASPNMSIHWITFSALGPYLYFRAVWPQETGCTPNEHHLD